MIKGLKYPTFRARYYQTVIWMDKVVEEVKINHMMI